MELLFVLHVVLFYAWRLLVESFISGAHVLLGKITPVTRVSLELLVDCVFVGSGQSRAFL